MGKGLESYEKKIVFFDVDNVLINGHSLSLLLKYLFQKRKIGFFYFITLAGWFILYKIGILKDVLAPRLKAIKYFKGKSSREIEEWFDDFFNEKLKDLIYKESIELIRKHKGDGYEVVLLSASISEIVNRLRVYLNLSFSISCVLEVKNGVYTGGLASKIPYGKEKVELAKMFLRERNLKAVGSFAYADHITDLDLLKFVSFPIVVNPDRKLRKVALRNKWTIYEF